MEKTPTLDMFIALVVERGAVLAYRDGPLYRLAVMMPRNRAGVVGRRLAGRGANQ